MRRRYLFALALALGVAQPAASELVGSLDTPGEALHVVVDGSTVYVADRESGVRVLDISDPTLPAEIGSFDTPGTAHWVHLVGTRLYVADGALSTVAPRDSSGLRILDVSDPTAPTELGHFDTESLTIGVDVVGEVAYLAEASEYWEPSPAPSGLRIVGVADPAAPAEIGSLLLWSDVAAGDVVGDLVYGGGSSWPGFGIVDVSDPTTPVPLSPIDSLAVGPNAIRVVDEVAFLADTTTSAFTPVDVSDPTQPELFFAPANSPLQTADVGNGVAIEVVGGVAYVLTTQFLVAVDVADPSQPFELGRIRVLLGRGIAVSGDHSYVAQGVRGLGVYRTALGAPDCDDGLDNDGDGLIDAEDANCEGSHDPTEAGDCEDGRDNDQDGLIDEDDVGCLFPEDASELDRVPLAVGDVIVGEGHPFGAEEGRIVRLDPETLDYSVIADLGLPVRDVAVGKGDAVYATTMWDPGGPPFTGSVLEVDSRTGSSRSLVAGLGLAPCGWWWWPSLGGLSVAPDGSLLVTADAGLIRIDPATGASSVLSAAPCSDALYDVVVDATGAIYAIGSVPGGAWGELAVFEIDPTTGARTPVVTAIPGVSEVGASLDVGSEGKLLVASGALLEVDPGTGSFEPRVPGSFTAVAGGMGNTVYGVERDVYCGKGGCQTSLEANVRRDPPDAIVPGSGELGPISELTVFGRACGDGQLDTGFGEECDDGNHASGDGCDSSCLLEVCGNGRVEANEECDDENTAAFDGCDEVCLLECGNGVIEPLEDCDDGNRWDGDGCSAECQVRLCGSSPASGCYLAERASLSVDERKPGSEKLEAKLKRVDGVVAPRSFGDPVDGETQYDLCIFDDRSDLVAEVVVARAGEDCGSRPKPCWTPKGMKGFDYEDPEAAACGVKWMKLRSGDVRKGSLRLKASNRAGKGRTAMPEGIALALEGSTRATVQLLTSDAECFEAELDRVKKAEPTRFKAKVR